jgi:hypothetical protein
LILVVFLLDHHNMKWIIHHTKYNKCQTKAVISSPLFSHYTSSSRNCGEGIQLYSLVQWRHGPSASSLSMVMSHSRLTDYHKLRLPMSLHPPMPRHHTLLIPKAQRNTGVSSRVNIERLYYISNMPQAPRRPHHDCYTRTPAKCN